MTIRIPFALLVSALLALAAAPALSQEVRATLTDAATGAPVAEAMVRVETPDGRLAGTAFTGADGTARVPLAAPGTYRLSARRGGYRPAELTDVVVERGAPTAVVLGLAPSPLALDTLLVIAPGANERGREGFARRQATSPGVFLDSAYLASVGARHVNDYLRAVPGIQLDRNNLRAEPRVRSERGWRCMVLLVDGRPLKLRFADGGRRTLHEVIGPRQVVSVEVFREFREVPPEYRAYASSGMYNCGVYLYWTRVGW